MGNSLNKGTSLVKEGWQTYLFYGISIFSVLCALVGFSVDEKALIVLPMGLFVGFIGLINFRFLYFLLLAMIPFSIEFDVSSSLATDLPTEPLMAGLMIVALVHLLKNVRRIDFSIIKHPIVLLLIVHLFWIFFTSCLSLTPLISFKYLLAKLWYVSAFFTMTLVVIKDMKDIKKFFWSIFIPLLITVLFALFRHSLTGFHFDEINPSLRPFYRNHVSYAAIIAMFTPFVFFARNWCEKGSFKRNLLTASVLLFIVAVYFSYTRASYLALIASFMAYFIFRFRLAKLAILAAIIGVFILIRFVTNENHYIEYSPTTNTVSQHEFGDLVDATFKAEDVSSMERIYRWIAAVHMANDRPITGFGPAGFYSNYKDYTVFIFETWISENEERSGVHNYFLMVLVEQGVFGLLIFVSLLCTIFIYGEKLYHRLKDKFMKQWVMAVLLCLIGLLVNLVFSDMIEVDKTGSFFFIGMAMLVIIGRDFKYVFSQKVE